LKEEREKKKRGKFGNVCLTKIGNAGREGGWRKGKKKKKGKNSGSDCRDLSKPASRRKERVHCKKKKKRKKGTALQESASDTLGGRKGGGKRLFGATRFKKKGVKEGGHNSEASLCFCEWTKRGGKGWRLRFFFLTSKINPVPEKGGREERGEKKKGKRKKGAGVPSSSIP